MKKIILLIFIISVLLFSPVLKNAVYAFDAWDWQQTGYSFRTIRQGEYNFATNKDVWQVLNRVSTIAGWRMEYQRDSSGAYTYIPKFSTMPFIGLREDFTRSYTDIGYQMPALIGNIIPLDFPASFSQAPATQGNWSYRQFTYSYNTDKTFSLIMSRLTPAVYVETNSTGLNLFQGKKQYLIPQTDWRNVAGSEYVGNPKYVAFQTSSGTSIQTPDASGTVDISALNQNWMLMWFAENTYLYGGNNYIFPARALGNFSNPQKWLYKVDMPVLVVFEKKPHSIAMDTQNGGVQIGFGSQSAGKAALLPLLGSCYPFLSQANGCAPKTEDWKNGLPAEILTRAQNWYQMLGKYPFSVTEQYQVDGTKKDITITDTVTYKDLGFGSYYVPVSPVTALAKKEGMPIVFSNIQDSQILDTQTPLTIGPYHVIKDIVPGAGQTVTYSYSLPGISTYATDVRIQTNTGSPPDWIPEKLSAEINKIVDTNGNAVPDIQEGVDNHLAPWWPVFKTKIFDEMPLWSQLWETPYYLSETASALQGSPLYTQLQEYIAKERMTYPPESYLQQVVLGPTYTIYTPLLPLTGGTFRTAYPNSSTSKPYYQGNAYNSFRPSMSLYGLASYYQLTGDTQELNSKWTDLQKLAKPYISNSDWATMTMTPYTSTNGRHMDILQGGISETNRIAGLGASFYKLSKSINDTEGENFGLYIFNKALISRFAQDKLMKHLYQTKLQVIPGNADWLVTTSTTNTGETGEAILWRRNFTGYQQDVRKPIRFDQFGIILNDFVPLNNEPVLAAYKDITPELGHFMRDYLRPEAQEWMDAVEENQPAWYKTYADSLIGQETPFSLPHNSYQAFLVKDWILKDTPDNLKTYMGNSWVNRGDYYYVHKLAETIKAYTGWCWSGDGTTCDDGTTISTTPMPSVPGDNDNDDDVDIFDYNAVITDFGKTGELGFSVADFDGDGDVDIFDYNVVISNFGR